MRFLVFPLILLTMTFFATNAQNLPEFSVPKEYKKITEVIGDLDNDGINEFVYVYDTNISTEEENFKRELYICKQSANKIFLWKKNNSIIWNSKEYGFYNDSLPKLEIKNNTLIIQQRFQSNSRHQTIYKNIFRFQNGDWFLIGATTSNSDNCLWEFEDDINFSTKKVRIYKHYDSCEDDGPEPQKDEEYNFKYPFKEIHKMDNFFPGKTYIKMDKEKMNFSY